jgi:hypothetical protein
MTKMWDAMNDLEMLALKVCSAREIIDAAVDSIQARQNDKAETLMNAAHEFLGYYLNEFDAKFKVAWQETVCKQKTEDEIEEENLVRSWHITVDEAYNKDGETIFSYLQFPDSLIERMGLEPESKIQWIVNPDDTVTIRKIE